MSNHRLTWAAKAVGARFRPDRGELAGACADLGTDLPLIAGMIAVAGLDPAGVLVVFGLFQVLTGLIYRMPMPVQPLKAMAALVMAHRLEGAVLYGGGLAVGVLMLVLTLTGLLSWLARVVPHPVVRGIQLGLGLQLALCAGRDFIAPENWAGRGLAAITFAVGLWLWNNRRWPAGLAIVCLGGVQGVATRGDLSVLGAGAGLALPTWHLPAWGDILTGLVVLALPQLPLSVANSMLATHRLAADLFPDRAPSVRRLGWTYAVMNLMAPWLGGVPVCHGSGGLAGHYAFGARRGVSVMLYGGLFVVLGLFFSRGFDALVQVFPRAVLGVLLLVEGGALFCRVAASGLAPRSWGVAWLTALCAAGLPHGYVVGLIWGWVLHGWLARFSAHENASNV
jgi:hypothetical protein